VDRELYIPRSWTRDPDRCRAAGLDEDTAFATKPELAAHMIGRFLGAGHRADWVAADEVYGGNPKLRSVLESARSATYWPSPAHMNSPPARGEVPRGCPGREGAQTGLAEGPCIENVVDPAVDPKALAVADRVERGSWPPREPSLSDELIDRSPIEF
jgi:hypothetical protein